VPIDRNIAVGGSNSVSGVCSGADPRRSCRFRRTERVSTRAQDDLAHSRILCGIPIPWLRVFFSSDVCPFAAVRLLSPIPGADAGLFIHDSRGGARVFTAREEEPEVRQTASQGELELAYQVGRLTQEVEQLRQEQALRASPQVQQVQPPRPATPSIPKVVVFRDGHRLEIRNYAIVGQVLWILMAKVVPSTPSRN